MRTVDLEVIACSAHQAKEAEAAGAHRIELVSSIQLGGLTPSPGTVEETLASVQIPVVVMARPREGNFVYDDSEFAALLRDLKWIAALSPAGIVTGVATADGKLDQDRFQRIMDATGTLPIICHRVFDRVVDQMKALELLVKLRVARVLTSGQKPTAHEGLEQITALHKAYGGEIDVMPAGGVRPNNVFEIVDKSRVRTVHASTWKAAPPEYQDAELFGLPKELDPLAVEALRHAMLPY